MRRPRPSRGSSQRSSRHPIDISWGSSLDLADPRSLAGMTSLIDYIPLKAVGVTHWVEPEDSDRTNKLNYRVTCQSVRVIEFKALPWNYKGYNDTYHIWQVKASYMGYCRLTNYGIQYGRHN